MLLSGLQSLALPPQQHAVRGVIEGIDHAKLTLLLVDPKTKTSRTFVWNDSTRFRQDGQKTTSQALQAGIEVKGYYRKEVGRFVLRELRWSNTASSISETNTQHDPESAYSHGANNPRKP